MLRENSCKSKEAMERLSDVVKQYSKDSNKQKAMQRFYQWNKKYRSRDTYDTTKSFFERLL